MLNTLSAVYLPLAADFTILAMNALEFSIEIDDNMSGTLIKLQIQAGRMDRQLQASYISYKYFV
jgi:hypothetical protein